MRPEAPGAGEGGLGAGMAGRDLSFKAFSCAHAALQGTNTNGFRYKLT